MGKKVNVKDLLESAILDNTDTKEEVEGLREQRHGTGGKVGNNPMEQNKTTDDTLKDSRTHRAFARTFPLTKLSRREQRKVMDFERLMEQNDYTDKKEQFIFRLSKTCFEDYERLASACSYKLEKKVSRNDIMRKALEIYHQENIRELQRIIDKI
ncbi:MULTISPECIES: hypothetical protein [Flagellimonas]|uniref:DUF3408 domain-containing protein n=2 Tax=Flagellimonas TaxID=444459 RepID=A0A3A1NHU5_9FLAO|nr:MULTISPECIES: hypothetical protein [Allomuricauda]MBW8242886.1 hypothetical protein [Allomuricauda oceani]QII45387.1 hypothetical protein GVT53_12075 [Allomuricauda oceani]RIV42793.1 hypothetical protein D2V05_14325 [Allomuricauda maritima]TXJ91987.1 hypothetical protein FQ017_14195 [Allomuricauda maritima]